MTELTTSLSGEKELVRALKKLDDRLQQKIARQALRFGAKEYQKELKARLPKTSGPGVHLANSIKIARERDDRRSIKLLVGVSGIPRFYAHIIEFGSRFQAPQPVWRPVFQRLTARVTRTIGVKLGQLIIKEVRRGN